MMDHFKRWMSLITALWAVVVLCCPPVQAACCGPPPPQTHNQCCTPQETSETLHCCQADWKEPQATTEPTSDLGTFVGAAHEATLVLVPSWDLEPSTQSQGFVSDESKRYLRLRVLLN